MTKQLNILTFPLLGTSLIEASAGTGKTYTIAALYLRLVLGHGGINSFLKPLIPPEILVVTYTNAATEELRDRIRKRLSEGAEFFREKGDGDDFLHSLRSEYDPGIWANKARLLEQASLWMDESAIYTIHAWCQHMLQQHAFDSGLLFDLTLEPNEGVLLEEAACDYWRCHFYPLSAESLSELLRISKCTSPLDLLKKVRPWLYDPEDLLNDPFFLLDDRIRTIEDARLQWQNDFDNAVLQIQHAQQDKTLKGNMYQPASVSKWLDQLTEWVKEGKELPERQVLDKFSTRGLTNGTAKNRTVPKHPSYDVFDELVATLDSQEINSSLLKHSARFIKKRVQQEKLRRAQVSFDDLLTSLRDSLYRPENERLAKIIRTQFPVALIDEFQDTDPVQYDIFKKIYVGSMKSGLFMIGDPKQAIYSFRGADIHTYIEARKDSVGSHYTLGTNYRSTKCAVAAVNQVFRNRVDFSEGVFLFKDEINYDSVAAKGRESDLFVDGEKIDALNLWVMPQDGPTSKSGDNGYQNLMAEAAATEIVHLLNLADKQKAGFGKSEDNIVKLRPADIVILVREGSEAKSISKALAQRQVRSVYLSDKESVYAGNEISDLLYLLKACAEPDQGRLVRAALAVDLLAQPLVHLDNLNHDELLWEAEILRFRRFNEQWQHLGVLPMLRALLREFNVAGRLLSEPGGERKLTNVLHVAEILQDAGASLDGKLSLIRWLSEKIHDDRGISLDEDIIRLESDEELVKIVTIHKSKGLEYPLVFLPFVCSYRQVSRQNSPMVKYRDSNGKLKLVSDPDESDLQAADRERLAEDLRMLYVALTRAQYATMVGVGVLGKILKKGEKSLLHHSALGYLLGAGQIILTNELNDNLEELKGDCQAIAIRTLPDANSNQYLPNVKDIPLRLARKFNGTVARDWNITSYSGLLGGADNLSQGNFSGRDQKITLNTPESAREDQLLETTKILPESGLFSPQISIKSSQHVLSIHNFPKGPEPGTFLHDLLEWMAEQGFNELSQDRPRIHKKVKLECERHNWEQWVDVLSDWLIKLINTPFIPNHTKPLGTMADIIGSSCRAELEFMFSAKQVNSRVLDNLIIQAIIPDKPRPSLKSVTVTGMLKGFIDLLFCYQGRYFVLDYKSNHLGVDEQAYNQENMSKSILEHRYDLQYVLYTLALHRLLKSRMSGYNYNSDLGGVIYLFLRGVGRKGQGAYFDKPPFSLIDDLDNYFKGMEDDHAA